MLNFFAIRMQCLRYALMAFVMVAFASTISTAAAQRRPKPPKQTHSTPHSMPNPKHAAPRKHHDRYTHHSTHHSRDKHARRPLPDSTIAALAKQLSSANVDERCAALQTLNQDTVIPRALATPILTLIDRHAATARLSPITVQNQAESGEEEDDESPDRQYAMELAIAATSTGDPRARIPLIKTDALLIGDGIAQFVAGGGPSLFPTLESYAKTDELRLASVITTYGLMLAKYPRLLRRADSAHVIGYFLAEAGDTSSIASDQLANIAPKVPLPEFTPLLQEIATTDPFNDPEFGYIHRQSAAYILPQLTPLWNRLTPKDLLARTSLAIEGLCTVSKRPLKSQCANLNTPLTNALSAITKPKPDKTSATKAIQEFQTRITTAERNSALSRRQAAFFRANTTAAITRL